jgi:hypothetical protein
VTASKRDYGYRICGTGRPIRWGEFLPQLIELLRRGDLRHPRQAYGYAAAKLFAEVNGWTLLLPATPLNEPWEPEELADYYQQSNGRPAAVIHTCRLICRDEMTDATLDELPGSWHDPSMQAYVIRDDVP